MRLGNRALWATLIGFIAIASFVAGMIVSARLDTGAQSIALTPSPQITPAPESNGAVGDGDIVLTQGLFRRIVEQVNPGVVNISTAKMVRRPRWFNELFKEIPRRWFQFRFPRPDNEEDRLERNASLGSGFVIDPSGLILTNLHVIEDAADIEVILYNGHRYRAEVVGRDSRTDVALLKIEPEEKLQALKLGDSNTVRVGDWVLAIGNPFGFSNSVTAGIVSGRGGPRRRLANPYIDYIQTDAPINPGSSGGPLINMRGEVIGINNWIWTDNYQWMGLGFAIPINPVKQILPQLREKGYVERGYLGVEVWTLNADEILRSLGAPYGAPIHRVEKGTPADDIGLKRYDVIMEVNGEKVDRPERLADIISRYAPGTEVTLKVWRDGKTFEMKARLARFPEEERLRRPKPKERREMLGLVLRPIPEDMVERFELPAPYGLLVERVVPKSPAYEAQLREGDVIIEVDRRPVRTVDDFVQVVTEARENGKKRVLLFIYRISNRRTLFLTLPLPEE